MSSTSIVRFTRVELLAIDKAIELISKTFESKVNAKDLSDRYNISVKKLQAGFVKRTGLTIHAYIEAARLQRAKELLADDMPLKAIAELVGYKSHSQFGFFFKKHTALTPIVYRRLLLDTEIPVANTNQNLDKMRPEINKL